MKRDGWLHVYDLGLEEELKYPRHGREEGQGQCGISHAIFFYPSGYMLYGASRAAVDSLHAPAAVRLHDAMP